MRPMSELRSAQNETIGKVVDREPQDERPELMLVDAFLGRVVCVSAGKRLGQKQEREPPDETQDRRFSSEFQTLGKKIYECQLRRQQNMTVP